MSEKKDVKTQSNDTTTSTTPAAAPAQPKPAAGSTPINTASKTVQPASKPVTPTPPPPSAPEAEKDAPKVEEPKKEAKVEDDIASFFGQKVADMVAEPDLKKAKEDLEGKKALPEQPKAMEVDLLVKPTIMPPSLGRTVLFTAEKTDSIYDPKKPQYPATVVAIDDVNELILDLVVMSPSLRTPVVTRLAVSHKSEAKEGQPSWDWPIIKK